ncbi:MAG: hypothetical protein IKT98_07580 [Selenomonadaceae bacterium]|nr:hypothetical protein [Selenomonadaceae bacterium]
MWKLFCGYVRTLRNYFQTPKARHDFKDYARVVVMILLTTLIIFLIIRR